MIEVMITQRNKDYWRERAVILESAANQKAEGYAQKVKKNFEITSKNIQKDITYWYQRFADNNQISLVEAKRLLNSQELDEFKWDVQTYIRYGEENAVNQKWLKELENASARVHISRLESLNIQLQQQVESVYTGFEKGMNALQRSLYTDQYYHTAFELQKGMGVGYDLHKFDSKKLDTILSTPWTTDKRSFSDRIWMHKQQMLGDLQTGLAQNIVRGEAPDNLINSLAKKMETSKYNAGRLVMTESTYFSSVAQRNCYKDLGVERFEIVAVLDSSTSEICRNMDGVVCDMSLFEPGVTAPPFHVWCRSTTVPYFDDDFGERFARGEDGKGYYVPSNMKYAEWKAIHVDKKE